MMVFLLLVYLGVLLLLMHLEIVPSNLFWKASPLVWLPAIPSRSCQTSPARLSRFRFRRTGP
jgi:hypothetical protein